jgi:hypothetical protein
MAAPFRGMGRHYGIGRDYGQPKPTGSGEYRMTVAAGPKLGIQVLGSTEPEYAFKERDIPREQDEPVSIDSKQP